MSFDNKYILRSGSIFSSDNSTATSGSALFSVHVLFLFMAKEAEGSGVPKVKATWERCGDKV